MLTRTLAVFIFVAGIATISSAQDNTPSVKVGDHLFVTMTGDLAKEYYRLSFPQPGQPQTNNISIETSATIAQELGGKRYRIEFFNQTQAEDKPLCLVTFSTVIDASQLKTEVTQAQPEKIWTNIDDGHFRQKALAINSGALSSTQLSPAKMPIFRSPAGIVDVLLRSPADIVDIKFTKQEQILRLTLSDLKGVTLRSWKLDEEVSK